MTGGAMVSLYASLIVTTMLLIFPAWSWSGLAIDVAEYRDERREEKLKRWHDDDKFFTNMLRDVKSQPLSDVHHSIYRE